MGSKFMVCLLGLLFCSYDEVGPQPQPKKQTKSKRNRKVDSPVFALQYCCAAGFRFYRYIPQPQPHTAPEISGYGVIH